MEKNIFRIVCQDLDRLSAPVEPWIRGEEQIAEVRAYTKRIIDPAGFAEKEFCVDVNGRATGRFRYAETDPGSEETVLDIDRKAVIIGTKDKEAELTKPEVLRYPDTTPEKQMSRMRMAMNTLCAAAACAVTAFMVRPLFISGSQTSMLQNVVLTALITFIMGYLALAGFRIVWDILANAKITRSIRHDKLLVQEGYHLSISLTRNGELSLIAGDTVQRTFILPDITVPKYGNLVLGKFMINPSPNFLTGVRPAYFGHDLLIQDDIEKNSELPGYFMTTDKDEPKDRVLNPVMIVTELAGIILASMIVVFCLWTELPLYSDSVSDILRTLLFVFLMIAGVFVVYGINLNIRKQRDIPSICFAAAILALAAVFLGNGTAEYRNSYMTSPIKSAEREEIYRIYTENGGTSAAGSMDVKVYEGKYLPVYRAGRDHLLEHYQNRDYVICGLDTMKCIVDDGTGGTFEITVTPEFSAGSVASKPLIVSCTTTDNRKSVSEN